MSSTQLIIRVHNKTWPHISANYMVILRPLLDMKEKLIFVFCANLVLCVRVACG
jgi:hypothetical protein